MRSGASPRLRVQVVCAALVAVVAVLSFHSVCDLLFSCGCRPIWAGGVAGCNIHRPGVPHCPFCTGGLMRLLWIAGLIAAAVLVAIRLAVPPTARPVTGVAAGVLAGTCGYALGSLICGLIAALSSGYPRVLGFSLPW